MAIERCEACGFDSERWSDDDADAAVAELPARFVDAVRGLGEDVVQTRPIAGTWSIVEYVDHVREVLFGMRFLLDSAVAQPGVDLGDAPSAEFSAEPRAIEINTALSGLHREAQALRNALSEVFATSSLATVIFDGTEVDAYWICRHALHDALHHLGDIERLRQLL